MAKQKTITLHTDPDFVVLYAKKWAEQIKKDYSPAEYAMAQDIVTMVELGRTLLVPATDPAEPGNKKNPQE